MHSSQNQQAPQINTGKGQQNIHPRNQFASSFGNLNDVSPKGEKPDTRVHQKSEIYNRNPNFPPNIEEKLANSNFRNSEY